MCCLFGLIDYRHSLTAKQKNRLVFALAVAAEACEFQSNGAPVPEERCAHSNANGVAVPFQTA